MTDDTKLEVLKSLRSQWMTIEQLCFDVGVPIKSLRRWLQAAVTNGVVASRQSSKVSGRCGQPPAEFAVTRSWGGIA